MAYGRIRAIGNDNGRVERQQEVLSALLSKASSISKLEYPSIIQQLAPLCETSLTFDKMIGLAQIALTGFDIERLSIPSDVEAMPPITARAAVGCGRMTPMLRHSISTNLFTRMKTDP